LEGSGRGLILMYYPSIRLEGLSETRKRQSVVVAVQIEQLPCINHKVIKYCEYKSTMRIVTCVRFPWLWR
jgi:hypothetical protein